MTTNQDAEHLRLLSIFHYIYAAITAFYSLFALIYVVLGVTFTAMPLVFDAPRKSTERPIPISSEQERSVESTATPTKAELASDETTGSEAKQMEDGGAAPTNTTAQDETTVTKAVPSETHQPDASDAESAESRDQRHPRPESFPPAAFGLFFVGIGLLGLLIGGTYAIAQVLAGRFIAKRKHRVFCMVVAGFNCFHFPIGVILAVFTFIVLVRPSVKLLFEQDGPEGLEPADK